MSKLLTLETGLQTYLTTDDALGALIGKEYAKKVIEFKDDLSKQIKIDKPNTYEKIEDSCFTSTLKVFSNSKANEQGKVNAILQKSSEDKPEVYVSTSTVGLLKKLDKYIGQISWIRSIEKSAHKNNRLDTSNAGVPTNGTLIFKNADATKTEVKNVIVDDLYIIELIFENGKLVKIGVMLQIAAKILDKKLFLENKQYIENELGSHNEDQLTAKALGGENLINRLNKN